jgi:hypothetical protein
VADADDREPAKPPLRGAAGAVVDCAAARAREDVRADEGEHLGLGEREGEGKWKGRSSRAAGGDASRVSEDEARFGDLVLASRRDLPRHILPPRGDGALVL